MKSEARWISYQVLLKLQSQEGNSSLLLREALGRLSEARDRALTTELVLGTLRWQGRLSSEIARHSNRAWDKLDPEVRILLLLGAYQLRYTRIPAHAAIDETVSLCRRAGKTSATGYLNVVLRKLSAQTPFEPEGESAGALAERYSHPEWLVQRWIARFGINDAIKLLAANQQPPPFLLRLNSLKGDSETILKRLAQERIETRETIYGPEVREVTSGAPQFTQSFAQGDFYIQDASAEALGRVLNAQPGDRILDVAAAPGGKTFQAALRMEDRGLIVSADLDYHRMQRWKQNMARLGITSARPVVADARRPSFLGAFDRILIDAPCTSLGVIRRHPEIKWWRKPEDLAEFAEAQSQILEAHAAYAGSGGEIIYSVCSFEPEETTEVKQRFLSAHPEFHSVLLDHNGRKEDHVYLFPHLDGTDGFFIAKFRKTG
jgi:16S rRNA (cytosine967-C5)-methyltransferase